MPGQGGVGMQELGQRLQVDDDLGGHDVRGVAVRERASRGSVGLGEEFVNRCGDSIRGDDVREVPFGLHQRQPGMRDGLREELRRRDRHGRVAGGLNHQRRHRNPRHHGAEVGGEGRAESAQADVGPVLREAARELGGEARLFGVAHCEGANPAAQSAKSLSIASSMPLTSLSLKPPM